MSRHLTLAALLTVSALLTTSASASSTSHADRTGFLTSVGASTTDDYANAGYADNTGLGFALLSNVQMDAVFGQTRYQPTWFFESNMVFDGVYCSACNGSFLLDFTHTTYGSTQGVFGVGLDIAYNHQLFYAFVTYGDNSTSSTFVGGSFFGLTSSLGIKSIHFGLADGGSVVTDDDQAFAIDNLTIAAAPVPEPETYALMLAGLAGVVGIARRRKVA